MLTVAALHFASVPRSIWEYDESLFAGGVEHYQPLRHQPPPPGYPLYIGFAKLIALFTRDALHALLATSCIAVIGGLLAFLLAFSSIADDEWTALIAAVLLYVSPSLLISGTLPQSDAGALALFGLAIWGCVREGGAQRAEGRSAPGSATWLLRSALCALPSALCIGWRLQLAIAVVPMFLAAVVMMRSWRERIVAVGTFGIACLCWFVPLVVAAGGPVSYWGWLSGQAAYYAYHDADLSRSGHSASHIALRFIAHPWGPKWLSLPLQGAEFFGVIAKGGGTPPSQPAGRQRSAEGTPASEGAPASRRLARRRPAAVSVRRLIPLACGALVYLAFALATMDPADAVRYAIPSLPLIALLAAIGLRRVGTPVAFAITALYAIGSFLYAAPVLRPRTTSLAPPAAAAQWIRQHLPANTLILYELPLGPHAGYLLRGYQAMRFDEGLARYGGDLSRPMVIYADGERGGGPGMTFRWPDTDAYRKLTREHYGAVSVIPMPPSKRFTVIEGVFPPERTRGGRWWRWLGARAIIELPSLGASKVHLTFRTPRDYPLPGNRIRVQSGAWSALVAVPRAGNAEVLVPITKDDRRITIAAEQTFMPARVRGANNRDQRVLSVMLTSVSQIDPQPAATQSPQGR